MEEEKKLWQSWFQGFRQKNVEEKLVFWDKKGIVKFKANFKMTEEELLGI